ncbi:chromate transporter [Paenibacillus sp. UNCCL117]|uniref:chromate transporter n=1 Tax=unclassified Paenibacillus TaxID=185978 RepID=UPI000889DB39|nr:MULTISPECIES: chromate transporter [unclassified Paenibacillus]SDE20396.1 chromate transporter [Paenibacillus sp. cl123]SFW61766.1 chromate transporter [Paenibacillus sp. UNCCL117]
MALPAWKLLGQIFWSFFKIGPVTFGGGYAMIPLIEREVVQKRGWVEGKDIADIFALSESIPGAIAINSASFVGFRVAGIPGAVAALTGILLPTFAIVIGLCAAFLQVRDHPKIEAAFVGIRAATVALIVVAGIKIGRTAVLDKATLLIVIGTIPLMLLVHINPVVLIIAGALAGMALAAVKLRLGMMVPIEHAEPDAFSYKYTDYYVGDGI